MMDRLLKWTLWLWDKLLGVMIFVVFVLIVLGAIWLEKVRFVY